MAATIYVINTATLAVAEYAGTLIETAIGAAAVDGDLFFACPTEVFENTGDDDDGTGITAFLTTGGTTPAGNVACNVPKCSFGFDGLGTATVTRYTKQQGAAFTPTAYAVTLAAELDQYELPLETRQLSRSWQFKLQVAAPDSGTNAGAGLETFDIYVNPARHRK